MATFAVISVPKEKALETKFTTTINPLVITACAHRNIVFKRRRTRGVRGPTF